MGCGASKKRRGEQPKLHKRVLLYKPVGRAPELILTHSTNLVKELDLLHNYFITSAHFAPDGNTIVTTCRDGTARLWHGITGKELLVLDGHNKAQVTAAAFASNGQFLLTGTADSVVRLWNAASGVFEREMSDPVTLVNRQSLRGVARLTLSPDERLAIAAGHDHVARLWSMADGALLCKVAGFVDAVYTPSGSLEWIATCSGKEVRLWSAPQGALEAGDRPPTFASLGALLRGHSREVTRVVVSPAHSMLATASSDGTGRMYSLDPKNLLASITDGEAPAKAISLESHDKRINDIAYSADGQRIATGSEDGLVKVWNADDGSLRKVLKGHTGGVLSVKFAPSGAKLMSASRDESVRIWDSATGELLETYAGLRGIAWQTEFSATGDRVLVVAAQRAFVWSLTATE